MGSSNTFGCIFLRSRQNFAIRGSPEISDILQRPWKIIKILKKNYLENLRKINFLFSAENQSELDLLKIDCLSEFWIRALSYKLVTRPFL